MITRKLFFRFPKSEIEKPIVYHLVKDYDLIINIFRARVTDNKEGYMVLDVTGEETAIEQGMEFVRSFGVAIDPINKGVRWIEDRCTHCTNCIAHCPTNALHIVDRRSMRVAFTEELCVECLNCLTNCPYGACTSAF